MSEKILKGLTASVGVLVVGIVFTFGMGVYTAVREYKAEHAPVPVGIPTPAMAN